MMTEAGYAQTEQYDAEYENYLLDTEHQQRGYREGDDTDLSQNGRDIPMYAVNLDNHLLESDIPMHDPQVVAFLRYDRKLEEYELIRLTAGAEPTRFTYGGDDSEGFHRTHESYAFDGETVIAEHYSEGRDCDGAYESHTASECPTSELHSFFLMLNGGYREYSTTEDGFAEFVAVPKWRELSSSQRDHSAEAAGY